MYSQIYTSLICITKYISTVFFLFITLHSFVNAVDDPGIFGNFRGNEEQSAKAIREGDIHIDDIPNILKGAIDFFMGIAGTISVIFIIIGAYYFLFGSLTSDKTKGRDTVLMAIGGFIIASLAWFIIKLIIDNLS